MGKIKADYYDEYQKSQRKWYRKLVMTLGKFIINNRLRLVLGYTWGLVNVLIGYLVLIFLLPFGNYKGLSSVTSYGVKGRGNKIKYLELKWTTDWGFSIGNLIVVGKNQRETNFIAHEFGHTIQNCIFGPFMLLFVYIPSFIRFHYRNYITKKTGRSPKALYDQIWFEETASDLGSYYVYKK